MDYKQMTSPCGIDCFNCPVHLATEDATLRVSLSEIFEISLDDAECSGCRNACGTISCLGDSEPCRIFQCTSAKCISYCYECDEFPCDYLHPYADKALHRQHNTKVFNLCLIKKMGVERWAREKAAKVKETYFHGKLRVHGMDDKE